MLGEEQNINDIDITTIDFDWVEKQTKPNFLKRAIKILELDGNYYPDLTKSIKEKLKQLDPKYKSLMENQQIDPETKKKAEEEILKFQEEISQKSKTEVFDEQQNFYKRKKAESEKIKGNEAMKSNDLDEALKYYTRSLEFDDTMAASYCNRALVYLKQKKYQEVIKDCSMAIKLDIKYIKAYHRRAQANLQLKNYLSALDDLEYVLLHETENKETILKEINEAKKNLTPEQLKTRETDKNVSGFKRITIVEENDDDDKDREVLDLIENRKKDASLHMKEGRFGEAIKFFDRNLIDIEKLIKENNDEEKIKNLYNLKASNLNNISLCYMQMDESNNVINFVNLVLELEKYDINKDILIKAYLRRAMQYEKIEKLKLAKNDFLKVKELDPSNLKASQGLHRVNQLLPKEVYNSPKKPEKQINIEEEYKILEVKKEKGNDQFRKNNYIEAKQIFTEIIEIIQTNYITDKKFQTLYLQALNNRAFSNFNLTLYEEGKSDCDCVLKTDSSNVKAYYRRALCLIEILKKNAPKNGELSSNLEELKKELALNDLAIKDLESALKFEKNNSNANKKLEETVKYGVRLKLKIKEIEDTKNERKKETTPKKEKEEKKKEDQTNKLNKGFLNDVTHSVVNSVIEELINNNEIPNNANIFEKDCKAFKNNVDRLFFYLKKIPFDTFLNYFSKKDIPTETFFLIIDTIKITGINENPQYCLDLLNTITKTNKFDLCLMFLTKSEKSGIINVFNKISEKIGENETITQLKSKFK